MTIFENWPHKWFGLWSADGEGADGFPRFVDCVDTQWAPHDKDRFVEYLSGAPTAARVLLRSVKCGICGAVAWNPGAYKSDGVWLWHIQLSHMVDKHWVRLPDAMVLHIRLANYTPPALIQVHNDDLPWPAISEKLRKPEDSGSA